MLLRLLSRRGDSAFKLKLLTIPLNLLALLLGDGGATASHRNACSTDCKLKLLTSPLNLLALLLGDGGATASH
jgi:hypothetical protein